MGTQSEMGGIAVSKSSRVSVPRISPTTCLVLTRPYRPPSVCVCLDHDPPSPEPQANTPINREVPGDNGEQSKPSPAPLRHSSEHRASLPLSLKDCFLSGVSPKCKQRMAHPHPFAVPPPSLHPLA